MSGDPKRHIAVYPGSFDPATFGHLDVIRRGRKLFDHLIVGVGRNPDKATLFDANERVAMIDELIREMVAEEPDAASTEIVSYDGLTVDFATQAGATVLLRGIRNLSDLQNEVQQALTNRQVAGLETAFIVAGQDFAYTSSSLIKQIAALGRDMDALRTMCPQSIIERIKAKKRAGHEVLANLASES